MYPDQQCGDRCRVWQNELKFSFRVGLQRKYIRFSNSNVYVFFAVSFILYNMKKFAVALKQGVYYKG